MFSVYDIETLRGMFLYVEKNLQTGKITVFRIDRYKNELLDLINHLQEDETEYAVSYNGLSFDSQVIQFIIEKYKSWSKLTGLKIASIIYQFAQDRIDDAKYNIAAPYKLSKLWKKQIDLFKIHHFDNKNRRCSLKWLEYSMDFPNIEEMPIDHRRLNLTRKESDEVIFYCINDVLATEKLYYITRGQTTLEEYAGKDKIADRFDIIAAYNLPIAALNWSDVRIGDELNKLSYSKLTGLDYFEIDQLKEQRKTTAGFTYGECIPSYVSFKTKELQEFYNHVSQQRFLFKVDQEFKIKIGETEFAIKKGGIHSTEKKRMLVGGDGILIIDADVGSQYPNAIVKRALFPSHLGRKWLINYQKTISLRLEYKAMSQDETLPASDRKKYAGLAEFLKLALNGGGFGKTNDKYNWQYDPFVHFRCTIGNQFEMLMLIESLHLAGISVVSANTDGIVCKLPQEKESCYYQICKEWETIVGNSEIGKLEFTYYDKVIQTSVNDYLAIKSNGKIKKKGDFATSSELHKNKSRRIIPIALEAYFVNDIAVKDTICSHDNLFDFCIGLKASKEFHYEAVNPRNGDTQVYDRVIRYYMCPDGKKLLKVSNTAQQGSSKGREQCEAGYWQSSIVNKLEKTAASGYEIDFDYYIHKCNEIIEGIEKPITTKKSKKRKISPDQLSFF
ncbi:hypothetical protein HGH93_21745 [Chitinophaga polysaccharea]|uniref:hypothetical protein n=1 Tax=Chitinophaga polysaccharea TaxID=1293035 RepID=UPI0014558451|nr:hypothetical protein [Chitinophaga polysaccharea]NLR60749.1 hypothetical protein [Chitinophaga polysaccharea]